MSELERHWVSWWEPCTNLEAYENGENGEYESPEFPEAVRIVHSWLSGQRGSDNAASICAVVDAPTQGTIENGLEGFEIRFIEPRDRDWLPSGDRFK